MLNGPIIPKSFVTPTQKSPNPSILATSFVEDGEIFTCQQTGRVWILGKSGSSADFKPVLPYVRNDGTPTQIATQFVNNGGQLKAQNEAGTTGGSVNLFDQMTVSSDGVFIPSIPPDTNEPFDLIGRNNSNEMCKVTAPNEGDTLSWDFALQQWRFARVAQSIQTSISGDFTISAANTETFVTGMSHAIGNTGGISSAWLVTATVTGFHNSNWQLSVGLQQRDPAPNLGTTVFAATSVEGTGWITATVQGVLTATFANTQARLVVASTHAGSLIKSNPSFAFSDTGTYSGVNPNPNKSTRLVSSRIIL